MRILIGLILISLANTSYAQLPENAIRALVRVNFHRTCAHIDSTKLDAKLTKAADNHAEYVKLNCNLSTVHNETQGNPGYTGNMVNQRTSITGYTTIGSLSEDIAFTGTPEDAVDTWICSFYHRIPVIWQFSNNIGYADREIDCGNPYLNHVNVMDFDLALKTTSYVMYPFPGQNQIPVDWTTREGPEPFPRLTYPRGFPVTLTLPTTVGKKWKTTRYNIEKQSGGRLTTYCDEPAKATGYQDPYFFPHQNSLCLVTQDVLEDNTVYRVTISLDLNGDGTVDTSFAWSFGTGDSNPPIDRIYGIKEDAFLPSLNPNPMINFTKASLNRFGKLEIFDINGRLLYQTEGAELFWNGKDVSNIQQPIGVYLYRISTGGFSKNGKILKLS